MSRLILICLVLAATIVTSKKDTMAVVDAHLNTALQQGRIWLGLEIPATQTAEGETNAAVSKVSTVQGLITSPVQRSSDELVKIKPGVKKDASGSATIRMLDSMTKDRSKSGARFVKVAP